MTTTEVRKPTARERAIAILEEVGEEGISKSAMKTKIGGNPGAFRRLMMSMEDKGEMTVTEEDRPTCGLTKVLRKPA
jgi:hypothetical protein